MAPIQVLLVTEEFLNFHRIILSGLTHNVFNNTLQNIILYLTPLFLRHKMKYDIFKKEWNSKPMINWMLARTNTSFVNNITIHGVDLKSTETSGRHKIFLSKASTKNFLNIAQLILPLYNESSFHYHFMRKINLRALWKFTSFFQATSFKLPVLTQDVPLEFKLPNHFGFSLLNMTSHVYSILRDETICFRVPSNCQRKLFYKIVSRQFDLLETKQRYSLNCLLIKQFQGSVASWSNFLYPSNLLVDPVTYNTYRLHLDQLVIKLNLLLMEQRRWVELLQLEEARNNGDNYDIRMYRRLRNILFNKNPRRL